MSQRHYDHDQPPPQPDPPSPRENLDQAVQNWQERQVYNWNDIKDAVRDNKMD